MKRAFTIFSKLYESGGQYALVSALNQMERPVISAERIAGLFDEEGNKLAGNMPIAPDLVDWRSLKVELQTPGGSGNFHLFATRLETSTLVVGRSTRSIDAVLRQLLYDRAIAGLAVVIASLLIGYVLSQRN